MQSDAVGPGLKARKTSTPDITRGFLGFMKADNSRKISCFFSMMPGEFNGEITLNIINLSDFHCLRNERSVLQKSVCSRISSHPACSRLYCG